MKLRRIEKRDDLNLYKIIRNNLENYHLNIPGTAYYDTELKHLSRYYNSRKDCRRYYVLEEDKVKGGGGFAAIKAIPDGAEIQKVYLCDEAKGKGYGRMLMLHIEKQAKAMGFKTLYLETHSNLIAAIHLYEKLGYKEIKRPEWVSHSTMDKFYIKNID